MMDNVTQMRTEPDDHFGGCPRCGGEDGYLNVERSHWFVCRRHRVRWFVGANLFSSWQHEEEWEWEENARELYGYEEVEPLLPEPPPEPSREELEQESSNIFNIFGDEERLEEMHRQDLSAGHQREEERD